MGDTGWEDKAKVKSEKATEYKMNKEKTTKRRVGRYFLDKQN
jgi:hypothetical protein